METTTTQINGTVGLNDIDLCVRPIEIYFDEKLLAHATGFLWKWNGKTVLVTSWHNFSGQDIFDRANLSIHGARPNRIKFTVVRFAPIQEETGPVDGVRMLDTLPVDKSLLAQNGDQLWHDAPSYCGLKRDIAFLDVSDNYESHRVLNGTKFVDIYIDNGQDLYIAGYPYKKFNENGWEVIWKRGSIATNPRFPWRNNDCFLVDATTTSGMSGSPVFARKFGPTLISNGDHISYDLTDTSLVHTRFLGIYGGHLGQEKSLNLGIVWRAEAINNWLALTKIGQS